MVAERRALDKVLEKVGVDVLGHVGADAAGDVVRGTLGRGRLVAQGAARGVGRGNLGDGGGVGAGGAAAGRGGGGGGSLWRAPGVYGGRRGILADDDGLAGPDGSGVLVVLFLVGREAGELLLRLVDDAQGVQVTIARTLPPSFPAFPALWPGRVTLRDLSVVMGDGDAD